MGLIAEIPSSEEHNVKKPALVLTVNTVLEAKAFQIEPPCLNAENVLVSTKQKL